MTYYHREHNFCFFDFMLFCIGARLGADGSRPQARRPAPHAGRGVIALILYPLCFILSAAADRRSVYSIRSSRSVMSR